MGITAPLRARGLRYSAIIPRRPFMRKTIMAVALILVVITVAVAANAPKGNIDRGRNYFRDNCKNCHTKGAAGGEVTPLNKSLAQWRTYFEKGKHGRGTLKQLASEQQLLDVKAFLVAHAADSEQPEICGR
jgi:mono/diheme cytochrome c family protein